MLQRLMTSLALAGLLLVSWQTDVLAQDKTGDKIAGKAAVAHIRLAGDLDETPVVADPLFGTHGENFKSKIDRINQATKDENVQALLIHVDGVEIGWAKVAELRQAIESSVRPARRLTLISTAAMPRIISWPAAATSSPFPNRARSSWSACGPR